MGGTEEMPGGQDEFRAVNALREAVATRRHAEMLFDMVLDHLGEEAWVESWNGETTRTLFRREGPGSKWILPWPLLSVTRGGREGPSPVMTAIPGVYEEPRVRPGQAPRLRDLGPGSIGIHDGPDAIGISYGKDGRWFECTRSASPDALAGVVPLLAAKDAPPVEIVAAFVAGLDLSRHGPGRVHLPAALPGGAPGAWSCGLYAVREALFHERVPRSARWVAADGWTGGAIAWGATRESAMEAWRVEVARVRPFPEKPEPRPGPPPESFVETTRDGDAFGFHGTLVGPRSDVPWIEPTLENSPAMVMPLGDLPAKPPALGAWTRLVNGYGTTVPAALRLEPGGFTMIGDRILETLDLGTLEVRLAEAESTAMAKFPHPPDLPFSPPPTDTHLRTYQLVDEGTGAPVRPAVVGQSWSAGFRPITLDGDLLRWSVLRLRPERG